MTATEERARDPILHSERMGVWGASLCGKPGGYVGLGRGVNCPACLALRDQAERLNYIRETYLPEPAPPPGKKVLAELMHWVEMERNWIEAAPGGETAWVSQHHINLTRLNDLLARAHAALAALEGMTK